MKLTKPEIFNHKKFQAAFITTISALFGILGPALVESATFWIALGSITPTEWALILGPILIAIGAQGWADSGKEAAKINRDSVNHGLTELEEMQKELEQINEAIK